MMQWCIHYKQCLEVVNSHTLVYPCRPRLPNQYEYLQTKNLSKCENEAKSDTLPSMALPTHGRTLSYGHVTSLAKACCSSHYRHCVQSCITAVCLCRLFSVVLIYISLFFTKQKTLMKSRTLQYKWRHINIKQ